MEFSIMTNEIVPATKGKKAQKTISIPINQTPHMSLIEIAVKKNAPMDQLEKLMDLQERHEANLARKSFNAAMSIFQSLLPSIEKKGKVSYDSKSGYVSYDYAKLEDIAKAIKPALKESWLSYRFNQEQHENIIKVTCIVTHIDGHSESSSISANPDTSGNKDFLKAIGSTISYLKRYTLTGLLGVIVGGEDDEGGEGGFVGEHQIHENQDFYPDKSFNEVFPVWEKLILEGRKTSSEIITNGNNKGITFSENQLNKINSIGKK